MASSSALFAEDYWNDAARIDAALQAEGPVVRATLPTGVAAWIITGYEEARAALNDPRLSKDITLVTDVLTGQLAAAGRSTVLPPVFGSHMLFSDPPAHGRLRALVQGQFTHDRVQAWRPRMERITTRLLAALSRTVSVDLIAEVAFPLPVAILGALLDIPDPDQGMFGQWLARMMPDDEDAVTASWELSGYLSELIVARRAEPGQDVLSALACGVIDGDRLRDEEVVGTTMLIVVGQQHMTNLLGNGVRWLLEQPDAWRRVGLDPGGLPAVTEELLRFDSPARLASHRCTIAPVVYGGVGIPAGELVLVSVAAANRDPRCFPRPDRIDWQHDGAPTSPHLALGYGLHHCLGAGLTGLQAQIVLSRLARSFPHARLAVSAGELSRLHSVVMNGFRTLPVLLGPL